MPISATFERTTTFFCFVFVTLALKPVNSAYFGKSLGKLSEYHHGVSGEVFAVDGRTLYIKDFTYDGQGPAAYFWAGNTRSVGNQGFRIRDENGRPDVLRRYRKEGVTITLPEGKTLRDIKWFSVWCEEFEVNFGDVKISRSFDFPRPQKLASLQGVHGISSDGIVIVDAQTLLIPNLSYDGEAPDAKFWAGTGSKPTPQGIRIPNENGKETPLRRYDHKTIVLTLPGDLTVFDIGHFGIWCEAFTVDFAHVQIPAELNVPPSLKMLGVSPQKRAPPTYPIITEPLTQRPQSTLVGGYLEATTYRPRHFPTLSPQTHNEHTVVERRIQKTSTVTQQPNRFDDGNVRDYRLINTIQNSPGFEISQRHFVQNNQYYLPTQNNYVAQQQQQQGQQSFLQRPQTSQDLHLQIPQLVDTNNYYQRKPVPYTPFNFIPQQTSEQIAYNQLIQNRRILEEQLTKQHNRFVLPSNSNYQHFG